MAHLAELSRRTAAGVCTLSGADVTHAVYPTSTCFSDTEAGTRSTTAQIEVAGLCACAVAEQDLTSWTGVDAGAAAGEEDLAFGTAVGDTASVTQLLPRRTSGAVAATALSAAGAGAAIR